MGHRSFAALIAFAFAVASGATARADEPCARFFDANALAPALAQARQGRAALSTGDMDEALRLFQKSYCLYPEPALKHYISYASLALNLCDEAYSAARFWAATAPAAKEASAQQWLKTVQMQCIPVALRSAPIGASVRIDKSPVAAGTTPRLVRVRAGNHSVTFSKAGYSDVTQPLTLATGLRAAPVIVSVKLAPLPGTEPVLASSEESSDLSLDLAEPSPAPVAVKPPSSALAASTDLAFDLPPGPPDDSPAPLVPVPPKKPHVAASQPAAKVDLYAAPPPEVPTVVVVVPKEAPRRSSPPWVHPTGWAAIGVGAALLVVATALGAVASTEATALKTRAQPGETIQARLAGINADGTAADALFAVGGVLAATGVTLRVAF